jgi:hypothetical protein
MKLTALLEYSKHLPRLTNFKIYIAAAALGIPGGHRPVAASTPIQVLSWVGVETGETTDKCRNRRGGATACPRVACQAADVVFAVRRLADGLGARDIIEAVMLPVRAHSRTSIFIL